MKRVYKICILFLILILVITPSSVFAFTKKETVFTNLDNRGNVIKNIVNNNLSFIGNETEDETILKEVLNISGEEKLNIKSNKITFKTDGKDLTYQGITTKELPIDININYYFNNKKSSFNELKGKKGHITISIDLENNLYNKQYNLHTPFVVTSGLIINGKNNSNIEVTSGTVLNTGTRSIVVGVAAPGLKEDLGLNNNLDNIEIEFDTKNFDLYDIYLVASPKILSSVDIDKLNKLDSAFNDINKLSNGMNKLEDGSKKLTKGTKKLNKGTKKFSEGLYKVLEGSNGLKDGAKKVDNNLSKIISGLEDSKGTLDKKSKKLIEKIGDINEVKNNNSIAINNLESANSMISSNVSEINPALDIASSSFITVITNLHEEGQIDDDTYKTLSSLKTQYDGNVGLITLLEFNNTTIDTLVSSLTTTSSEISTSLSTLDGYLSKLEKEGTSAIAKGSDDLSSGLLELYNGSKKLTKGTKELKFGSKELANGIEKVNKEGISKITDVVNEVSKYKDKIKDLMTLSKKYKGYASSNSDEITFIFKVNK